MKIQVLKNKKELFIFPTSPFHFNGTFHKPSHFPDKLSDWESGKYWQTIRIGKRLFGLKIENKEDTQNQKLRFQFFMTKLFLIKKLRISKMKLFGGLT